jgi:hypothetical protein
MFSFLALLDIISKFYTMFISILDPNPPITLELPGEFYYYTYPPPPPYDYCCPKNGDPILTISMLRFAMEFYYPAALPLSMVFVVAFC